MSRKTSGKRKKRARHAGFIIWRDRKKRMFPHCQPRGVLVVFRDYDDAQTEKKMFDVTAPQSLDSLLDICKQFGLRAIAEQSAIVARRG